MSNLAADYNLMAITNFDVLVVYSHRLAKSASSPADVTTPFAKKSDFANYNIAYSYLLAKCSENHVTAAFTTSADIIDAGTCSSYWLFLKGKWLKVVGVGYSNLIFDKFSPVSQLIKQKRKLLFSSPKVKPFNSPFLFSLFFDKYATYKKLKSYSIPTVPLAGRSEKQVSVSLQKLILKTEKHANINDFSNEVVLKDRHGAGGRSVFKFKKTDVKNILSIITKIPKTFVLQPFVKFDKGFEFRKSVSPTDIRLIFLNGKIIQTYLRIARKGDFRCNEHRGGRLVYVSQNIIPERITALSKEIVCLLGKDHSLFSLDFIVSNNGNFYLLEGNTGPGLDWNIHLKANEIQAKKLIRLIVGEIVSRTKPVTLAEKDYINEVAVLIPPEIPAVPVVPVEPTFI